MLENVLNDMSSKEALDNYIATRQMNLRKHFLATLLPPRAASTDEITAGGFRVVAADAKLTALDSPFATGSGLKLEESSQTAFKITLSTKLNESTLRAVHARAVREGTDAAYQETIARLLEEGVMQGMDNGSERFRALSLNGDVTVQEGDVKVTLRSNLPANRKFDRTTEAKGSWTTAGSTFWADVVAAGELNGTPGGARLLTRPDMWNAIRANPANKIRVAGEPVRISETVVVYRVVKVSEVVTGADINGDEAVDVYVYSGRSDSADGAGEYFWPAKRSVFFRPSARSETLIDGQIVTGALGYTYVAPNTHAEMRSVRSLKLWVPQDEDSEVRVKSAEFIAPVVQEKFNLVAVTHG